MKILKQKILFFLYFRQCYVPIKILKKEEKYLSYNFLYFLLFNFGPASIRKAIGELIKTNLVEKITRNRQAYFRLTIIGEKKINSLFNNFFYQNTSKRGWFLAITKPKSNARQLRAQLEFLGFARLRRGVYIRPVSRDFAKDPDLFNDRILIIFVPKLEFTDEKGLAGKLWHTDSHYKQGADFISLAKKLITRLKKKKILTQKEKKSISVISDKYFILIKNTIGLPKNLLPADWPLPETALLFQKILKYIE